MPTLGSDKGSRAFAISRFILELDGVNCGVLLSVDGGNFKSEAIAQQVGPEGLVTRYPGRQKFEDITITVGTSMAPGFWNWIASSIAMNPQRKTGAIVACDFDGNERARRSFRDALIAEIQFPACDAKAKSPAAMTVKISPEYMEYSSSMGPKRTNPETSLTKQKMWVPANYRLSLEKIDGGTTRHVTKIDSITIKQPIIVNPIGNMKWASLEGGRVEQPTLSVYVPETYSSPWYKWWKSFVGEMEHDPSNESTASLEFLASDCSTTLMTLSFQGVGITGLTFDKHDGGGDQIHTIKVELYTEQMTFSPGAGTA
jgi:phage tail-like protein